MKIGSNTKDRGTMRFLYLRLKGEAAFVGVCLDFNILEEGTDLERVKMNLRNASLLHLQTVQEKNLSDDLLNRHAPEKYWKLYATTGQNKQETSLATAKQVITTVASPYFGKNDFAALQH